MTDRPPAARSVVVDRAATTACVRTSPDKDGTVGGPPDNSPANRAIMAALHCTHG